MPRTRVHRDLVASTDRAAADELMQLHGVVDVLIPRRRGTHPPLRGAFEVPVIETGTGNYHVYLHESADADMARSIVLNAKCRRYGVCNAAETLLVDQSVALLIPSRRLAAFLPGVLLT